MTPPLILDTTLRDGSYAINFQFTANDTAILCAELERVGFPLIEIGHGIGLGATERGMNPAVETDEAYLRAAAESIKTAKWGMFCIPGVARLEHVDLAAEHGMSFIRIGTEVENAEQAAPFIERAKSYDMFVCANFMKSYALEPKEFAQKALLSQELGADAVYIVDSAGGMMADELERYMRAIQEVSNIAIGFHGHNNLELAVANTLKAIELGAAIIDTSLQGMGRSAGNTPAEILLMVLARQGISLGIDPLRVQDIGDKYIKPLIQRHGYDAIDVVSGYAQFHSSYMGIIREFSSKYRVDPRRLILALCAVDRVNAPRELVERLAREQSNQGEEVFTARFHLERYFGAEQNPGSAS
ncbi:MAG: 4-hydroxy-2-ketovalerate aldolase [Armatimonadetes bacterium]|jgi:4-hydroxy 2-oxovalerate aldolase/long-chain acyl-CoA synthetase|nr:4-hydroxy-2-ketovalerate aldolase [Armatimonadota bacterium]